jgi:Dynamin family
VCGQDCATSTILTPLHLDPAKQVSHSFHHQFDQHGVWRRGFALRLKLLVEWMKDHELVNDAVEIRLKRLEDRMRTDKITVAFVAEYSRGKSELINALFFADFGRRIMPASAGRTTMCPTEIGYESGQGTSLRLLPIETRLQAKTLADLRHQPEYWTRIALDVNRAAQLAIDLERVSETCRVPVDLARSLGLWHDEQLHNNPALGKDGLVEVPKWRHAIINMAHPLLRQGLVILDTPGLNAVGAEPELTLEMIPQADTVVFLLAADTGVTQSDLAIWRDHLQGDERQLASRLVVLNKIDTLWDGLISREQVQAQIDRQCSNAAELLGVQAHQVLAVSAQKGLLAKVSEDAALLDASCLVQLEQALIQGIIGQRQEILQNTVVLSIEEVRLEASRMIHVRRRDLSEQAMELKGLGGKHALVIKHMKVRIEQERMEFEQGASKIQALKVVYVRLMRDVFHLLSGKVLTQEIGQLTDALSQSGLKFGIKKAYGVTFERLTLSLSHAQQVGNEVQTMLAASFRQLNADFGFSLQAPAALSLARFQAELTQLQRSHIHYVGLSNTLALARSGTADRLVRTLKSRLRMIYETALAELELWGKSAIAQLDAQWRERRRNYTRRLEGVERVQQATGGLDARVAEIEMIQHTLTTQEAKLLTLTQTLLMAGEPQDHPDTIPALLGDSAELHAG